MTNLSSKLNSVLTSLPDDIEKGGFLSATSVLHQRANEIRTQRVNWQSYLTSQMISEEDYQFIITFDTANAEQRVTILNENRTQCAKTFLSLLGHIAKDKTIQYILIIIDDMLNEDKSRVEIFKEYCKRRKESVWNPFLHLLNRNDGFIHHMTSRIIAKIACWSVELMDGVDLHIYLNWLRDQLKIQGNEYLQSVARCLQMMLRIDEYRLSFVSSEGIPSLISVLSSKVNFQVQYQVTFCLWILTFNPALAEKMSKCNVIPVLADVLTESVKEKVTRIILATLRNLIEKPESKEISRDNAIIMIQCKVLKQLDILQQSGQKFEDEDIKDDIDFLHEKLSASVQDLSSFDEYSTEVKSGRLEWSPVHSSEKFWRENASKLNDNKYELLKILIRLLDTSKDALVLSVSAHDIGEYVRHYPRGKSVIEQQGGKHMVMQLLTHDDPNVRYEALLCVQKLMVHNWEYLGKQLQKDTDKENRINSKNWEQSVDRFLRRYLVGNGEIASEEDNVRDESEESSLTITFPQRRTPRRFPILSAIVSSLMSPERRDFGDKPKKPPQIQHQASQQHHHTEKELRVPRRYSPPDARNPQSFESIATEVINDEENEAEKPTRTRRFFLVNILSRMLRSVNFTMRFYQLTPSYLI
ncbi:V-type proton ATPase subunit H-like isoform X1 [Leptotrombidium deliense]|uniref:V-type proton ATPase subunit H-like isoform X1 n=1 Tax=Leptotrombidium deliense TaxID=299467 RepID=A0A443SRF5_9ACAR|nr:V-type proton ATPase subunit H-like isoform X1 [Leptotrombidium deliense]